MKNIKEFRLYLPVLLLALYFTFMLSIIITAVYGNRPRELDAHTEGVPIITTEPVQSNRLGIQQIAESSDRIYLLHQKYCVVSVYNKNGEYEYTISAYSHPNGRARIAVVGEKLHLLDQNDDLYVFHGTSLVMYSKEENSAHLRAGVDFDVQSKNYFLRGSNIYTYNSEGEEQLIIKRPWYFALLQRGTMVSYTPFVLMFIIGISFVLSSRLSSKKE